jgi:heme-degrading monooxygenase HmoA
MIVGRGSVVIVRISRARIKPNSEAAAFQILRDAVGSVDKPPGLEAVFISRRMSNGGNELVAISVWHDLEAMVAVVTDDWQRPRFLPSLDTLIEDPSVEHYETIAEDFEALKSIGA